VAVVDLDGAGTWWVQVIPRRAGRMIEVGSEIAVTRGAPRFAALWDLLRLPPAVVLLFALSRLLERRRHRSRAR
jgi:hypothetical protein